MLVPFAAAATGKLAAAAGPRHDRAAVHCLESGIDEQTAGLQHAAGVRWQL